MVGSVEVENLAAAVLNDEETVEDVKRQSGYGEEVEGDDDFAMVAEKGEPAFGFGMVTAVWQSLQVTGDGGFGNGKAELEQLAVNAGRAPGRVVCLHPPDHSTNFSVDGRPSWHMLP